MTPRVHAVPIRSGLFRGMFPCLASRLKQEGCGEDLLLLGLCRRLEGQEQINIAFIAGDDFRQEAVMRAKIMVAAKGPIPSRDLH